MHTTKKVSINTPHTTYRIQFHKDFNFSDFKSVIPYLRDLGIDTIYASPIFQSTPGSIHGYDGVNFNRINNELGTLEDLKSIKDLLNKYQIKWLQDIVPNHMAFHPTNEWLMNVLEFGQLSKFSTFFDTCYSSGLFEKGKLMVPILTDNLDEAISKNEIIIIFLDNSLQLSYKGNHYPISPESYSVILKDYLQPTPSNFEGLLTQINTVQADGDHEEWKVLRAQIFNKLTKRKLKKILDQFNSNLNDVDALVNAQHYELCPWWITNEKINFRRFFTMNPIS